MTVLGRPPRIAVSSHNLGFFAQPDRWLREAGAVMRYDRWWGHFRHDPDRSRELARWADVLVCEWCLGNAVYHTRLRAERRGLPARIIVRLHRFELHHRYGAELDPEQVALFVLPSDHVRRQALETFGWPAERTVVVPNAVDVARFTTHKTPEAAHTMGMLGWHRKLKRPDLALDLLELLRGDDPRWRLRLKGQRPEEVAFVWDDEEERAYFEKLYARIEQSDVLREGVAFEAYGPVEDWFTGIGYILSLSEVESFHLAAAEGMAAGCIPVFLPREAVTELFGDTWLSPDVAVAATGLSALARDPARRGEEVARARALVAARYDVPAIVSAWHRLLLS